MANKVLTISVDDSPPCPMEDGCEWTLVSFRRNSIHNGEFSDYVKITAGSVVPATLALRNKFRVGLAFFLDYYEHDDGAYSLHNEGMQCQWDTSSFGGILIWENKPSHIGAKTFKDRANDARGFLETYNSWMNGHVYGYQLEDEDGNDIASCWGFYDESSLTEDVCQYLESGDKLMIDDEFSMFDESQLPANVEIVEYHEKTSCVFSD